MEYCERLVRGKGFKIRIEKAWEGRELKWNVYEMVQNIDVFG
jgi:hypothetical protein